MATDISKVAAQHSAERYFETERFQHFQSFLLFRNLLRYGISKLVTIPSQSLPTLEQKNRDLAEVKIYKVLSLVCHITSKVSSNNDVPSWVVLFVKLFLDVRSNVLRKSKQDNNRCERKHHTHNQKATN